MERVRGLVESSEVAWNYVKGDASTTDTLPVVEDEQSKKNEAEEELEAQAVMTVAGTERATGERTVSEDDESIITSSSLDLELIRDPEKGNVPPFKHYVNSMMSGVQAPILGSEFRPKLEVGDLTNEYVKICKTKFSSFRSCLVTWMALIFLPMQRKYGITKEELLTKHLGDLASEAFIIMIKQDQALSPIKRRKHDGISLLPDFGILAKNMNMNDDDAQFLFGSNLLPVLSYESRLLYLLYREYHSVPSELGGTRRIHLSQSLTVVKLLTSTFAAFTPSINRYVRTHQSTCPLCLRSQEKKYALRLGKHYAGLKSSSNLFEEVFVDPVFPVKVTMYEGSKRPRVVQTLLVVCKNTLVTAILPMDRKRRSDVVNALARLEARTGTKVRRVYGDAAQIFNIEDGFIADGIEIVQLRKYGQSGNLAERKMAEVRLIIDRALSKTPSESIRKTFTWIQLLCFLSLIENLVNQIPYMGGMGGRGLSPDHFFRIHKYIKHDNTRFSDNHEFLPLTCEWENVQFYVDECRKLRDEILIQKARNYGQVARGTDIEPSVGDVAFLNATEFTPARICVIVGVHPRYLECRMPDSDKIEQYPRSAISIMVANNNKIEDHGDTHEEEKYEDKPDDVCSRESVRGSSCKDE